MGVEGTRTCAECGCQFDHVDYVIIKWRVGRRDGRIVDPCAKCQKKIDAFAKSRPVSVE